MDDWKEVKIKVDSNIARIHDELINLIGDQDKIWIGYAHSYIQKVIYKEFVSYKAIIEEIFDIDCVEEFKEGYYIDKNVPVILCKESQDFFMMRTKEDCETLFKTVIDIYGN